MGECQVGMGSVGGFGWIRMGLVNGFQVIMGGFSVWVSGGWAWIGSLGLGQLRFSSRLYSFF